MKTMYNHTNMKKLLTLSSLFAFALLTLWFSYSNSVRASAPPGLQATIATTSNPAVGTSAALVVATSSCAARIVTTYAAPVMITFADLPAGGPTGTFGHLQAASTTVVYDSGQYGCGAVRIYSFASQNITVSESR